MVHVPWGARSMDSRASASSGVGTRVAGTGVGAWHPSTSLTEVAASWVRLWGLPFALVAGNSPTVPVTRTQVPGAGISPLLPA